MVNNNGYKLAAGILLGSVGTAGLAAPFNSFDPRSMAMGGAGVAVSNGNTAPLFNPALLAVDHQEDQVFLTIPAIGARAYDPDEFVDAVDDFQNADYVDRLDQSISYAENNPTDSAAYLTVASDTDDLNAGLQTLDNKQIQGELGGAIVVGLPNKDLGLAFLANSWLVAGGVVHYRDAQDLATLSSDAQIVAQCIDTPSSCDQATYDDLTWIEYDGSTVNITYNPDDDIQSTVDIRGVLLTELGVSLAREFTVGEQAFTLGVTPKYVKAMVFDYEANVDTADEDDFDADDYTEDYADFNLDIGASLVFAPGWRAGLVVKNLIAQEYDTVRRNPDTGIKEKTGNTVELNTQVRAGVSWQADWYTLAADLDLLENEPAGLEDPSQYLSMGAELNGWDWAQFRLGYRVDLSNSDRNIASIGFGLSPGPVHFDVALAGNGDEVGAALQLGLQF